MFDFTAQLILPKVELHVCGVYLLWFFFPFCSCLFPFLIQNIVVVIVVYQYGMQLAFACKTIDVVLLSYVHHCTL